jgi:hypothetical protein
MRSFDPSSDVTVAKFTKSAQEMTSYLQHMLYVFKHYFDSFAFKILIFWSEEHQRPQLVTVALNPFILAIFTDTNIKLLFGTPSNTAHAFQTSAADSRERAHTFSTANFLCFSTLLN